MVNPKGRELDTDKEKLDISLVLLDVRCYNRHVKGQRQPSPRTMNRPGCQTRKQGTSPCARHLHSKARGTYTTRTRPPIAYRTRSGYYFILGIGGSASPYAEQEVIKPCSKEEAEALA